MNRTDDPFRREKPKGSDTSVKGDANEHRVVATLLERGFNASLVDLKNSKYDIVIEISEGEFIRLQVKTADSGSLQLKGGGRGGRGAIHDPSVTEYRYTTRNCDCLVGVVSKRNTSGGDSIDYYFVPTIWAEKLDQGSISVRKILFAKNNFSLLQRCKDRDYVDQLFKDVRVMILEESMRE